MKLKCPNKKCGYTWEYKGKNKFYTSCPRCKYNVKIPLVSDEKNKKEE